MGSSNKLDFTDQPIYIGLDVHKKSWSVSIHSALCEHKTFTQPPEVDLLVNYLRRNFPGASYHSVYEAGYSGFWVHDPGGQPYLFGEVWFRQKGCHWKKMS